MSHVFPNRTQGEKDTEKKEKNLTNEVDPVGRDTTCPHLVPVGTDMKKKRTGQRDRF